MSAPVFLSAAAADAVVGAEVQVAGGEAHHAIRVQRRHVGDAVDLIDGHGRRVRARISAIADEAFTAVAESVDHDLDPPLTLVQALAKSGRDEQAVEAATELGATRVIPWAAQRSIVQWKGAKAERGRASWASLVAAATKQSRRAVLPEVTALVTTPALVERVREAVRDGDRVLVLHEDATARLTALDWDRADQPVWLIVGPEGGIADAELEALAAAGAEPVLLGPHVLRASNAGPAAIAALAAGRGTWGDATTGRGLR